MEVSNVRPTRKTKLQCNVCHRYIRIKYNNKKFDYYTCDDCNITFVKEHETGKIVKAYVPKRELTI